MTAYLIVPTFKETDSVGRLVGCLSQQSDEDFVAIFVNASPSDATSDLIAGCDGARFIELPATPDDFWSACIRIGQCYLVDKIADGDIIVLLNSDVTIPSDFIEAAKRLIADDPMTLFCAGSQADRYFISSGCRMKSWLFALSEHQFTGNAGAVSRLPKPYRFEADMLAGRALIMDGSVLRAVGFVDAAQLPQYHADYEYTARAKRANYRLVVTNEIIIEVNRTSTGIRATERDVGLADRLRGLWALRSPLNLLYSTRFVLLSYPRHAIPTGLVAVLAKAILGALIGPWLHRMVGTGHAED